MCKHSQSAAYVPPNKAGTKPETRQKRVWDIWGWELCVRVPQLCADVGECGNVEWPFPSWVMGSLWKELT